MPGCLLSSKGFLVSTIGAVVGLATQSRAAAVLVVPPLVADRLIFVATVRAVMARQRDSISADEHLSQSTGVIVSNLRDIIACGGEVAAESTVGKHVDA